MGSITDLTTGGHCIGPLEQRQHGILHYQLSELQVSYLLLHLRVRVHVARQHLAVLVVQHTDAQTIGRRVTRRARSRRRPRAVRRAARQRAHERNLMDQPQNKRQ
jgi:hypothetical protein